MMRRYIAVLLVLTANAAHAQSSGEAQMSIDGEEVTFRVVGSQSEWGGPDYQRSVTIIMFPPDALDRYQQLWLMFDVENAGAKPDQILLYVVEDGGSTRLIGSGETGMTVALEEAVLNGSVLTLSGTVSVEVGTSDDYGRTIDLSDAVVIDGGFEVALEKMN